MATDQATLRHAAREDIPSILAMVCELAEYEKELASVEATEAKLEASIAWAPSTAASSANTTEPITSTKPARCILLFPPGSQEPAGMALYFYNYSTWRASSGIYLEDLFVRPAFRGRGYGKRLLVELARQVLEIKGGRLEWSVLKWNEPSIKFYRAIGATQMDEWVGMRVDREALVKLAGGLE
ncbi:uncharacterized protein E0L32_011364 [Thyridium curvatum]|uniref:N-acetyltransferase domain-containing protein n=1 Tax=Thyridium curvatum TaxID=1093900 RepID=A0A507BNV1_9PEZI|nr:uncharacterized protein E0L32_011364 [Thyridium curvatum]TPX18971.1 hypothetical protein E0L32_011364 [Thyridium curvatum]